MLKELKNNILENEFTIKYLKNKINVANYKCIDHFDDDKVMIRYKDGLLTIKGEELIIAKLLKDEILISGLIKEIKLK